MDLLDQYFELQAQIYAYFSYEEDYRVIPLRDETTSYWMLDQQADGSGHVVYSGEPLTEEAIRAGTKIYSGLIYTQRFLPRWVYRGAEYTMVCVDTQTDGNKFLMVFENAKEVTDLSLKRLYQARWG